MNVRKTETHSPDVTLVGVIIILCIFGLLMVFSASMSEKQEPTFYFFHQLLNFVVGAVALVAASMIDYHLWRKLAYPAFAVAIVLLVALHLVGTVSEGAQRWLLSGSLQPSEVAKLAVILFAAEWLPRKGDDVRTLGYGLFPFALLIGIVVSLIARQPDYGTAAVVLATAGSLFIVAGADLIQTFLAGGVTGLMLYLTAYGYQHDRIGFFWAPCNGGNDKLVQVCQGITAMGSGGIAGLGVGASRFRYDLTASFSDSILGIIGEEFGLFGTIFVVLLFVILIYRGLHTALHTPESFGRLVAIGITFWIAYQAFINLAGNVALLPFTGVPLPFISYGGSALVSLMFASGILLNISRQTQEATARTRGPIQRIPHAPVDNWRRDGRPRLPGSVRRGSAERSSAD